MSVVSTAAASGRPFLFDADDEQGLCHPERSGKCAKRISRGVEGSLPSTDLRLATITPASQLAIRPAPEMASSGIADLDALTGGLPRGCLTELCGPASSGRTTVLLAALSAATRRGEYCAFIDASDSLDPHSAAAAGIDLDHLLWVRCDESSPQKKNSLQRHPSTPLRAGSDTEKTKNEERDKKNFSGCTTLVTHVLRDRVGVSSEHRLEQVLRATDLLLESGGFGLIVLDLADIPPQAARRIPLTTWFRFRRAVEHKPTVLLAIEQQPIAGSCSSLQLQLGANDLSSFARPDSPFDFAQGRRGRLSLHASSHAQLLTGREINAELIRSRLERKPASSIAFETRTAWAG